MADLGTTIFVDGVYVAMFFLTTAPTVATRPPADALPVTTEDFTGRPTLVR